MNPPVEIWSPDHKKSVIIEYDGDVRFGPAFFRAKGNGFNWPLGNEIVGEDVHWSPDARYVVVLVFLSRDTSRPPNVRLLAVDTTSPGSVVEIDRNASGMIYPTGFAPDGTYHYKRVVAGAVVENTWTPS
jgi:hypothetical protein